LLRADLLPLRLNGFFFLYQVDGREPITYFFSRPLTACKISSDLLFVWSNIDNYHEYMCISDHCNGLLLLSGEILANPATRQWVTLPEYLDEPVGVGMERFMFNFYLAYDPMVSPHYEVVLIPLVPDNVSKTDNIFEESEWPPSLFRTHIFSSRKWMWEERSFVREGKAAGTIADMHCDCCDFWRDVQLHNAVYWRGALYVQCQNSAVMR
jgi:hypothetical protein